MAQAPWQEQAIADHGIDQLDSDFEQGVATALRAKGWRIQTQVGVGKFRVDLGVVNPDTPGAYAWPASECDGRTYRGSPSARDRDRTRRAPDSKTPRMDIGAALVDRLLSKIPKLAIDRIDLELSNLLSQFRDEEAGVSAKQKKPRKALPNHKCPRWLIILKPPKVILKRKMIATVQQASIQQNSTSRPITGLELKKIAMSILERYPCMAEGVLALERCKSAPDSRGPVKSGFSISRKIPKPWAGVWQHPAHRAAYWLSPEDVSDVVPWRDA